MLTSEEAKQAVDMCIAELTALEVAVRKLALPPMLTLDRVKLANERPTILGLGRKFKVMVTVVFMFDTTSLPDVELQADSATEGTFTALVCQQLAQTVQAVLNVSTALDHMCTHVMVENEQKLTIELSKILVLPRCEPTSTAQQTAPANVKTDTQTLADQIRATRLTFDIDDN